MVRCGSVRRGANVSNRRGGGGLGVEVGEVVVKVEEVEEMEEEREQVEAAEEGEDGAVGVRQLLKRNASIFTFKTPPPP